MLTTTEKLFVQIFDRKKTIIEQVRHEIDLYRQQLAPRLVIDGITPPSWLWKHGSHSQCSDPAELRKEELMSELLLPVQQPQYFYSTCQNSLFNNTVYTVDREDRQCRPLEETRTSVEGLDKPTCSHQGCINNVECVSESVPRLEPIITPLQDRTGAIMLDNFPQDDQSIARFQRSRSRQKALEIRNSAKTAARDHSNDKVNAVSSGGIVGIVSASLRSNHGNEVEFVKALEMVSESVDIRQKNRDSSQSKERHSSIHSDQNAVGSSQQPDHVRKPDEFNSSSDIANDDAVILEGDATQLSLQPHSHVSDSLKSMNNSNIKSFSLGSTTSIRSDRNAVGWSQQPDHVHKPEESNSSSDIANDDVIRLEGEAIKISLQPHNHVRDSLKSVSNSDVKSFSLGSTILGQTHLKERGSDGYCRQVTRSHSSCHSAKFNSINVLSESVLSPNILRPDGDVIQESQVQAKESLERLSKCKGDTDFSAKGARVCAGSLGEKDPDSNVGSTRKPETVGNDADEHAGGSIRSQTPCSSQGMPEHGNSYIPGSAMTLYRYDDSNQYQNPQASEIPSALPPLSYSDEHAGGSDRSKTPSSSQGSPEHRNFNISTSAMMQCRYAVSNQYQSAHASQTTSTLPPPSDANENAGGSTRSETPCRSQGLPEHGNSNISGAAITQSRDADSKQYQSNHASQITSAMPPPTENGLEMSTVTARVHTSMENCAHECSSRNTSSRIKDTTREKANLFNSNISVQTTSRSSAVSSPILFGMYETEDNEVVMATDLNVSRSTGMIDIHDERCASSLEDTAIVPDTPVDACMDSFALGQKEVSLGAGLEALASGPSSNSPMLVKPQKLEFDDNNKCRLNSTSSFIENREEEESLETRQSILLEPLHITESSQPRRASIVMEHSCPQSKRRKIEGQFTSVLSTSPSLTVNTLQSNHRNAVGRNFNWEVSSSHTVLSSPYEVQRVTQTDTSPNLESLPDAKFHILEESNDSQKRPVEEGGHSSGGTDRCKSTFTFKLDELVPSMFSILTKQEAGDSQCCRREEVGASSQTRTIIDVRRESNVIESPDLSHLRNQEGDQFSRYSVRSLHNQYLGTTDPGSYIPILEGFTVETEDEVSFHEENLPKSTLERASFLEQLCKSVSMHTPSAHFSSAYKLHQLPHLYQSVPNELLENIDLTSTLYLTDDTVEPSMAGPSCFKDEVNHTFHASSYSDQQTNPRSIPYKSPVGRLWERTKLSKSSSVEKNRCSNPELTCFPIAEDPNICEGSTDEVPDTFQDDIRSIALINSMKREPLAEVIEHYESSPTLVSDVFTFNDRPSLESPTTEDSLGRKNTVKQKLENHGNRKRRCTNKAKENQNMSLIANGVEHATESYRNSVSKPKLSRRNSLKVGGTSVLKESKLNNIVSNVTSFIPFLQPKQAVTGKRDIKVKALEAAEAAKRLEEEKENERKMKKEALKLKRARLEQENLKQLELKKKEKEEAQKKKDEDMAVRKRAREVEEKKEKASKRKRIEEVETRRLQKEQEQEEKVHAGKQDARGLRKKEVKDNKGQHKKIEQEKRDHNRGKVRETESRSIASSTDNVYKQSIAVYGRETLGDIEVAKSNSGKATANVYSPAKSSVEQSYEISPYKESDDEEEDEDAPNNKFIPSWSRKSSLGLAVSCQQQIDVDNIFPLQSFSSINEVLMPRKKLLK